MEGVWGGEASPLIAVLAVLLRPLLPCLQCCCAFAFQPLPEGLDVFEGMLYAVFPHPGAPQCRQVCAGVQCLADVARQRADVGALRSAHADVERHGVGVEVQEF